MYSLIKKEIYSKHNNRTRRNSTFKCSIILLFLIFTILLLTYILIKVYKLYCFYQLPPCWREYALLAGVYKWREELSEHEIKCLEEEVNYVYGELLLARFNDSYFRFTNLFMKILEVMTNICDRWNNYICINAVKDIMKDIGKFSLLLSKYKNSEL